MQKNTIMNLLSKDNFVNKPFLNDIKIKALDYALITIIATFKKLALKNELSYEEIFFLKESIKKTYNNKKASLYLENELQQLYQYIDNSLNNKFNKK